MPKLEIYVCNGTYGGSWEGKDQIAGDIAQLELEIQTLERQYDVTSDVSVLSRLNELKAEAAFYWGGSEYLYRSKRGEQFAREIYDYYKELGDEQIVSRLRETMYPMGYDRFDGFVGDEPFLTYPYDLSRLAREQAIVQTGPDGAITKAYWYDTAGTLRRIYLPQDDLTLFVEEYGVDGVYVLAIGTSVFAIYGGHFDDFNIAYRGGAGLSDIGVEQGYLDEIVQTTDESIKCLERSIREYEAHTGTRLSESQFLKPVDLDHPLVTAAQMNVACLIDGRGNRLLFERLTPTEFKISSVTLDRDRLALDEINRGLEEFGKGIGTGLLILAGIMVAIILFIVVAGSIIAFKVVKRYRIRRSR